MTPIARKSSWPRVAGRTSSRRRTAHQSVTRAAYETSVGSMRKGARDERSPEQEGAQLVRLAAAAEPRRRSDQRKRGDDSAEHGAEGGETRCIGDGCGHEEDSPDEIREARRTGVLQWPLADTRLHELEVSEARQAEAPAERQPDEQLHSKHAEQPPPTGCERERGQ